MNVYISHYTCVGYNSIFVIISVCSHGQGCSQDYGSLGEGGSAYNATHACINFVRPYIIIASYKTVLILKEKIDTLIPHQRGRGVPGGSSPLSEPLAAALVCICHWECQSVLCKL